MNRLGMIAVMLYCLVAWVMPAHAYDRKRRQVRTTVELKLVSRADLEQVRVGVFDPGRVRPFMQSLTDMLVVISARGSDIDGVLKLPGGRRPRDGRSLFKVRVLAVSLGQIHSDAAAWCGAWRDDVSVCQVDCDGGTFLVRRLSGGVGGRRLDLVVGSRDGGNAGRAAGFSLNSCQFEALRQLRVIPTEGRKVVPLAFEEP